MDKPESPDARARELLRRVLPDKQWTQFDETGVVEVSGSRGTYQMSSRELTRVFDSQTKRLLVTTCLQLSVPAPAADRIIAEYVLIRNDEDLYWRTANVFPTGTDDRSLAVFLVLLLDLILSVVLVGQLIN